MIVVNGKTYRTTMDAALELGVSTKTVRTYINKGIIPPPPQIRYGVRMIKHFPPEYIATAKAHLEHFLTNGSLEK
jgi:hypothetical protein